MLKLRIIVNNRAIYECREKQPVVIPCTGPVTSFMVTNGFHMSRAITVKNKPGIYFYEVAGNLDNVQLLTGLVLTLFFFTIYVFTGIRIFMLLANLPLFIMGLFLFVKRKSFIQVHLLKTGKSGVDI